MQERVRVGILGCGNVGSALVRLIHDHADVIEDRNAWDNEYLVEVPDADGRPVTVVASPVRFSDTPARTLADPTRSAAPASETPTPVRRQGSRWSG